MKVDSINAKYCFLDIDINNHRHKLAVAAAFVNATNTRYGFSSKDLLHLGGSEVSRIQSELIQTDHGKSYCYVFDVYVFWTTTHYKLFVVVSLRARRAPIFDNYSFDYDRLYNPFAYSVLCLR